MLLYHATLYQILTVVEFELCSDKEGRHDAKSLDTLIVRNEKHFVSTS